MEDSMLLDELVRALIKEGGQATLDRLLYAYIRLRQAGREKILEIARRSSEIIQVLEEELYRYHPDPHRYVVLRLAAGPSENLKAKAPLEAVEMGENGGGGA